MLTYKESYCEVWRWTFNYYIGWKWELFCKRMHDIGYDMTDAGPEPDGFCMTDVYHPVCHIWLRKKNDPPTLSHECIHAAVRCLERRGVIIDSRTDEVLAYMVTWMMKEAIGEKH